MGPALAHIDGVEKIPTTPHQAATRPGGARQEGGEPALPLGRKAITEPFTFPETVSTFPRGILAPLSGGGLAFRLEEEWVLRFPSGEAEALPAPDWLAAHPGSDLVLVRNGKAHALDGTVIQQIDLAIPANDQCAWRWWPKLLH